MARKLSAQPNVDMSDVANYPNGRIRNNDGSGNGTPVDEAVYGDIHQLKDKFMRDAKIDYNDLPDNESNGNQLYEAFTSVAGKNDLVKSITAVSANTLAIPIKISAMKIDESLIFTAGVDSSNAQVIVRGSDNVNKTLEITGVFNTGDRVRVINLNAKVIMFGLYDSENVPNLVQRLTDIEAAINPILAKLSIFQAGGGMFLWNKPANVIPAGFAEVVAWRGRIPVGYDITQTEFDQLPKQGGSKTVTLNVNQLPAHSHYAAKTDLQNGGSALDLYPDRVIPYKGVNIDGDNYDYTLGAVTGTPNAGKTSNTGAGASITILNPYRTVIFIEWVGI